MRVDFYHLKTSPMEKALPQLLERALAAGQRAVVLAASEDRVESLANVLWTYNPDSWLPHGSSKDGAPGDQPVWLTDRDENPNGAKLIFLTDGMASERLGDFDRCFDLFDGNDAEATTAARVRWSAAKAGGHDLHYWQQTDAGWKEQGV
jgi:DNA polymerase-3 subunit chi